MSATIRRPLLWLVPAALVLGPFFFAPLSIMLRVSFNRFVPGGRQAEALILDNYHRFFGDPFYLGILLRTLGMALAVTLLALILSYPLAYTLARSRSRLRGLLTAMVLVPLMTSVVVRSYGWTILLAQGGLLNSALGLLGLPPVRLMFTLPGVIIALTEVLMPFMVLTLTGVLQSVSPTLEEAARSLGGSRWRVFRDVLLPLSLPGVAAGSFLVFALSISAFATPILVGGASTQVMATMVYDQVLSALNWPFAAAIAFSLMLFVLGLTVLQGRILRGGLDTGRAG
jgi:putative spermidine/putrescine transport system permease protein